MAGGKGRKKGEGTVFLMEFIIRSVIIQLSVIWGLEALRYYQWRRRGLDGGRERFKDGMGSGVTPKKGSQAHRAFTLIRLVTWCLKHWEALRGRVDGWDVYFKKLFKCKPNQNRQNSKRGQGRPCSLPPVQQLVQGAWESNLAYCKIRSFPNNRNSEQFN